MGNQAVISSCPFWGKDLQSVYMTDCVFCKIVRGEIPAHKIWEDERHVAFLSIFPNTVGFTVVVTKEHKPSYAFVNDDQTLTDLILATKKVALSLDKSFEDVGRTGMFFEGFGVDHLHSKLFPMHGTPKTGEWKEVNSNVDKFFVNYEGYLSSHNGERADDQQLEELAKKIRKVV